MQRRENSQTFFGVENPNAPIIPQDLFTHIALFAFPNTPEGDSDFLKHALSNEELKIRYKGRFNTLVNKFFLHVVHGEKAKAEAMVQKTPGLLLLTDTVTDYSYRNVEGTALGIALGAEDVKCHNKDDEGMVEMLHRYLRQLPNGEAIIAEQTAKQFPEGWKKQETERRARDSAALEAVFKAIAQPAGKNDVECEQAMTLAILTFKKYLADENSPDNIIKTGKHFNHLLLAEALYLFSQHYISFGGFDSVKNNAVWRKVIGTIERYVPAATAQALCTGLGKIVDDHGKLIRSLTFYNKHSRKPTSYFPLDANPCSRLGEEIAVTSYTNATSDSKVVGVGTHLAQACKGYVQQKHQTCNAYIALSAQPSIAASVASAARP